MSRSSARRGQTEPLAALAAVLALGVALALYADALAAARPAPVDPGVADATLQRVHGDVTDDGVAVPGRLSTVAAPPGHELNATLAVGEHRWAAGPSPPDGAPAAERRTSIRTGRWAVRPGWLRVVVWS